MLFWEKMPRSEGSIWWSLGPKGPKKAISIATPVTARDLQLWLDDTCGMRVHMHYFPVYAL